MTNLLAYEYIYIYTYPTRLTSITILLTVLPMLQTEVVPGWMTKEYVRVVLY